MQKGMAVVARRMLKCGTSHRHYAVDLSTEGKPTAHRGRDHQQTDGPRKEEEEQKRDTTTLASRTGAC
jgi:hypothetical protein